MILDGRKTADTRLARLKEEIDASGLSPGLATVMVGDDPASQMYVRMKHRACEQVHIRSTGIVMPSSSTTEEVVERVRTLNRDRSINGILVQLPLPAHVDTHLVVESVRPEKDVDGFHPANLGRLFSGIPLYSPCTPKGIMSLLQEYEIDLEGLRAVVLGRSIEVGRPMAALLLNANATVTICHSKTMNLPEITREADILVAAVGKARFVQPGMVRNGAVVIDVGTNQLEGKLCGDVDFERVREIASAITPVPGGVGPMTIASLMENTLFAARLQTCTGAR